MVFEIKPIMGGLYLEGGAESNTVRSYFFYHGREKKYYHIALDFMGSMSTMSGHWQNDTLLFVDITPQKAVGEGHVLWRRNFFDIQDQTYTFTLLMNFPKMREKPGSCADAKQWIGHPLP